MAKIQTLEKKYKFAITVLQAISQRRASNKDGCINEWLQAEAFCDCREAARRCLSRLQEPLIIPREKREINEKKG